jgi:hypothetical protein
MLEYSVGDITWSMYITLILISIIIIIIVIIIIIIHYMYVENVVSGSHVTFITSVFTSTD